MNSGDGVPVSPSESEPAGRGSGFGPSLYRLDSNQSSSSVFEDVEMAHDEVRTRRSWPPLSSCFCRASC